MKTVVVTGAGKGLGLAACKKIIEAGFRVVGIGRTYSDEFKVLVAAHPDSCTFEVYDFNNTAGIKDLVKELVKKYGRVYGLVNNAALGHDGVLSTMHESQITELLRVNVEAPILLTKYLSRSMMLLNEGRIINVGSIIGSTGFNGLSVYAASKAAMGGFTKSLARELGKVNITVNTLAPGYMETAMTSGLQGEKLDAIKRRSPLGRLANVEDAAAAIKFLLSDEAKSITGTTITVDAGSTA